MKTSLSLVFFFLSFIFHPALAQVNVFGGPQLTTANYSIRNAAQAAERKQGFTAGIGLRTLLEGPVFFSPLLYFSKKGYTVTYNQPSNPPDSSAVNNQAAFNTVSLAPLLQFNFSRSRSHLFFRFGPALDVAVSGQEVFDTAVNRSVERAMPFSFAGYSIVTLFGAVQLGFQHKSGFLVFAHYEHGLSNLNNKDNGPMILNRAAGVSVGWRLGKEKR